MENFIIKFTNKYICFYSLFEVKATWNKGNYLITGKLRGRKRVKNHWAGEWLGKKQHSPEQ